MKIKKLCVQFSSDPLSLFFEITFILLQINCINNGINNGIKQKKKKACKTVLYKREELYIKEKRETEGEWLITVHTQNIPYLSTVTTQDKIRQRPVKPLLMRIKA